MTYSMLGDPTKGEAQLTLGIERLQQSPRGSLRVAISLQSGLCDARSFLGRYKEALAACREALALARRPGANVALGTILHDTAFMTAKSGAPLEEAEELYREALRAGPVDAASARIYPALINTRIGALRVQLGDLAEGEDLLHSADSMLSSEPGPPIEIIPAIFALALGARIQGRYEEAQRLLNRALDMLNQRPTAFMGHDEIELELAADEALAGSPQALSRMRSVVAHLQSAPSSPLERVRLEMLSGIVEARNGLSESAEGRFRWALATSEREAPGQPANRVEIYVRLAELLASNGKGKEAAEAARRGLGTAQLAYGRYFKEHPFVAELKRILR